MYWEPTFYSALYAGVIFVGVSLSLYSLCLFDLAGGGRTFRTLRFLRSLRAPFREAGIIMGLYTLWALIGVYNLANYQGADQRGRDIWHFERWLHLPSENWMQGPALHHPLWGKTLDQYYIYGHVNAMIILLLWLWFRHRDKYKRGRAILILFTLSSVVVQWVPVAPPRFIGYGVIDLGKKYGQTVYQSVAHGSADQLAAFPSVHEGWAILVAAVVFTSTKSRWRWVVLLHPIFMMYVVVVTGNHYWMDGIVAGLLLALTFGVLRLYDLARARLSRRTSARSTAPSTELETQPA
jgi:hypothetical protein